VHLGHFGGNLVHALVIHSEALACGQRLTRDLQQYTFVDGSVPLQRFFRVEVLIQFSRIEITFAPNRRGSTAEGKS
jgi:hypothetical protein